jgi:CMP-2-keto-3-deoxyoctulosonic acid synthetase
MFTMTQPAARHITQYAFMSRMTGEELTAIELASLDDPTAPMQLRAMAAQLRIFTRMLSVAQYIDLDSPALAVSLGQIEAGGLIGEGRAQAILSAPVQEHERP